MSVEKMKLSLAILVLGAASCNGFSFSTFLKRSALGSCHCRPNFSLEATLEKVRSTAVWSTMSSNSELASSSSSDVNRRISAMGFRELQHECTTHHLESSGTTATLRARLRQTMLGDNYMCDPEDEECVEPQVNLEGVVMFTDESDPDFEYKELLKEVLEKTEVGHWKAATRRLKKITRRFPLKTVPQETYIATLQACMDDRLHGARASEPARKVLENLVDAGYEIPADVANHCIQNCLGYGPNATHDGCGGIDTALAMLAAVENSVTGPSVLTAQTYSKLLSALIRSNECAEGMTMLRSMVVDRSFTPSLALFAQVAMAACNQDPEKTLSVLAYAKAAGYELDKVAATEDGRTMLAAGVIAAEKMDNVGLGLRLLTAASKAEGCAPDRGDDLVSSSSSAAQRASTLIHKRAINTAANDGNWRLAVKLLDIMKERSLKPSPWIWRNVVTCVAKAEKSRKATALLLDWVKLAENGELEKPPLSAFNTVVNACEICDEHELTLVVLETMKKTHQTEGNLVTFNIALKRLAKLGNSLGCEGIIIGMLQNGIEPSVVSYTTAIAACVSENPKNPAAAYEWLKRMRSRNVSPNVLTYNTALAACLDGKLESTVLGSKMATEMAEDAERQVAAGINETNTDALYTSVLPDAYTKGQARQLMKQLRENWRSGDINMQVAKATIRVPLLQLVDFQKTETAQVLKQQKEEAKKKLTKDDDQVEATVEGEAALEYASSESLRRAAEV